MTLVKVDQKMRLRIPKKISELLKLKNKEALDISVKDGEIRISKPSKHNPGNDPVLRDMIERPLHSKVRITSEMLEKIEDEMWYP